MIKKLLNFIFVSYYAIKKNLKISNKFLVSFRTAPVILSGITIGRGSIIGAGSVVTKDIPKYSIVGGNPAIVIKSRFKKETIDYLENLKWWEWDINKIVLNKDLFNLTENQLIKLKV